MLVDRNPCFSYGPVLPTPLLIVLYCQDDELSDDCCVFLQASEIPPRARPDCHLHSLEAFPVSQTLFRVRIAADGKLM